MKPKTIKIDEVDYVRADEVTTYKPGPCGPWEIGKSYFVRTVTYAIHGVLIDVTEHELVFTKAAWIADTGRFHQFITEKAEASEIEPFAPNALVIVGRGSLIDAVRHDGETTKQK